MDSNSVGAELVGHSEEWDEGGREGGSGGIGEQERQSEDRMDREAGGQGVGARKLEEEGDRAVRGWGRRPSADLQSELDLSRVTGDSGGRYLRGHLDQ
jgi:hypothetical protein